MKDGLQPRIVRDLSRARLRSNSRYEFLQFDQLPEEQQRVIVHEPNGAGAPAGILVSHPGSSLRIKAISDHTHRLIARARETIEASDLLPGTYAKERDEIVAQMVSEEILEIATPADFVSGWNAFDYLFEKLDENDWPIEGVVSTLSLAAVKHGARLDIDDPDTLAARMYFYHRIPTTRRWINLWPDAESVQRSLGISPGDPLYQSVRSEFRASGTNQSSEEWLVWQRRGRNRLPSAQFGHYKLYVSPHPSEMRNLFAIVTRLILDSDAVCFKIGPNAHALLRPDKFIVYFESFASLQRFCAQLIPQLAGARAHGVPFSAQLDSDGLVSWGLDPGRQDFRPGTYVDDSWRIRVCNRVALALLSARGASRADDYRHCWPRIYSLLWIWGINSLTWAPRSFEPCNNRRN